MGAPRCLDLLRLDGYSYGEGTVVTAEIDGIAGTIIHARCARSHARSEDYGCVERPSGRTTAAMRHERESRRVGSKRETDDPMNASRLPPHPGQEIDATRSVTFSFAGRNITAHGGDTFAAALYAAGVRIFSRSFKYHRLGD